jgi:hypothetical protein
MSGEYSADDQFEDLNIKDPREDSIKTYQVNQAIEDEVEEYSYHDAPS